MGRYFVEYCLPASGRREIVLFSAFFNYRLEDGNTLPVLQQAAWCPACRRFVIAEELPSLEALELEIEKYRSADKDTLLAWAFVSNGSPVEERIAELSRRVEWRMKRRFPPRCLECGRVGTITVPTTDGFSHPQTGEKVIVGESGFSDLAPCIADFSLEGERLPVWAAPPNGTGIP
jgi:hypothetical protein